MPTIVEVTAKLGDSVLDVARIATGGAYRIGDRMLRAAPGAARVGLVDVTMREVPAMRRSLPFGHGDDHRVLPYAGIALVLHLVLWGAAMASAPPQPGVPGPVETRGRVARASGIWRSAGPVPTHQPLLVDDDSPDDRRPGTGQALAGDTGAAGTPASTRASGHAAIAKRDGENRITRDAAIESAREAGILGAFAGRHEQFTALVGTADLTSGFDPKNVVAPLYGGDGEANGAFGIGYRGFGPSGGGQSGVGVIGVGRYGTIGNGREVGDDWGGHGIGAAGGMYHRRTAAVPTVIMCGAKTCVAVGALDKNIIRRYVRRQLAKIAYCYEKELLAHPDLAGDVATELLIAGDGHVQSVHADGVSPEVSDCVAGVLGAIEFPRSHDGSATQVTYPFTFQRPAS